MTGYEPLDTLKPVATGLWLIDGPAVHARGFPFSTRATVVRLGNGDLWIHSPTRLTDALRTELKAIGPVRHLIAPNQAHHAFVSDWQTAYPEATFWAAPEVAARAAKTGTEIPPGQPLQPDRAETPWEGQLRQLIVRGSERHREAVFFHDATRTLILTDLIAAFETAKLPTHCRPLVWLTGVDHPDGRMPPRIRRTFRDKDAMAEDIETLLAWGPRRIILAHGHWYDANGTAELERAFRKLLRARAWDRAVDEIKTREKQ